MPKQTFLNLNEAKRKQITDAFLREFAINSYDDASITIVVKQLGIAKGSIYQYFEDKLDLFLFLMGECSQVKNKYVTSIKRDDFPDFWTYFKELYEKGFLFDAENPLESHFLHNLVNNLNSPSVKKLYKQLLGQACLAFEEMVNYEVQLGLFRNDVSIKTMGFMLYKVGISIMEQMEQSGIINPAESIKNNQPVFLGKKKVLIETVDGFIKLAKPAFNKK